MCKILLVLVAVFIFNPASVSAQADQTVLAQADEQKENDSKASQQPRSGTIVLPNSLNQRSPQDSKKCMTVCTKWGEDCIIDPNRGRKCRRTCKEFGEECF